MKLNGSILAAVALAFASCEKPPAVEAPPTSTPAPATPPPATPPPATPTAELAPPGVFYLLTAARVETADGITGLPPGTGVKLVRAGVYLTPAGEAPLAESQLTNDMARARAAMTADRNSQAALSRQISTHEQQASVASGAVAGTVPVPGAGTNGDKRQGINAIEAQIVTVQNQIAGLTAQIEEFNRHTGQVKSVISVRRAEHVVTSSTLPDQKRALQAQLRELQMELSQAQRQ